MVTLINWSTLPEEKMLLLAVIVTVPSTASGVIVPAGLVVVRLSATFGIVRLRADADHVVLFAPRTSANGAKFSWVKISVSALCVKYNLFRLIHMRLVK